jgi:hypothetical protein
MRWAVISTALVVVATAVFLMLQLSPSGARGVSPAHSPEQIAVSDHGIASAGCPTGAPIPSTAYDLGSSFGGYALDSSEGECNPALPKGTTVLSGPAIAVGYQGAAYGTCEAGGEGCGLPLEIQSWPECARNPESYNPSSNAEEGSTGAVQAEKIKLADATWLPADAFEAGLRIELYTGETTIVVFADSAAVATEAAEALASLPSLQALKPEAAALRSDTKQPGDASTCTTLLPAGS